MKLCTECHWDGWDRVVDKTDLAEGEFIVDKTDLAEGEFTDPKVYTGPYPAGTHTYEIHVIALKSEPKAGTFKVDARSGDIQSFFDYVNTASDGSVGNVVAYGTIKAPYTSPELYYGYR